MTNKIGTLKKRILIFTVLAMLSSLFLTGTPSDMHTAQAYTETGLTVQQIADVPSVENTFSVTCTNTESQGKELLVCGKQIGIAMLSKGVLVTGISQIVAQDGQKVCPAAQADVRPGDILLEFDGVRIENGEHLTTMAAQSSGKVCRMRILRGETFYNVDITPAYDTAAEQYKLGISVRDSTSGIGTLTFVDPSNGTFASLGHGITEGETGVLLPAGEGYIFKTEITDIVKGLSGKPGELKGSFTCQNPIGTISKNTNFGLYGKVNNNDITESMTLMPVATRDEITLGSASILCCLDGQEAQLYDINIKRINNQSEPESKSMVIEVCDETLIEKTGGIVQGMSGSPIIQNGKIIGAVTHVMINSPTKGYGIFIDWMLQESEAVMAE